MDKRENNTKVPNFNDSPLGFKGGRFEVRIIDVPGKNGHTLKRDVVVYPGSVIILPLLDSSHIVMIRNERFAVGKTLWELPAGTLEPLEDPLESAKRELTEETGYKAGKITPVGIYYTSPGFCNELMHSYIAEDLTLVGQSLDENEHITVEVIEINQVLEMIHAGIIVDAKTISTILYFKTFLSESYAAKK